MNRAAVFHAGDRCIAQLDSPAAASRGLARTISAGKGLVWAGSARRCVHAALAVVAIFGTVNLGGCCSSQYARFEHLLAENRNDHAKAADETNQVLAPGCINARRWTLGLLGSGPHFGRTPMTLAADEDNVEVLKVLLAHGAELEKRDGFGMTPLAAAVCFKRWEAAEYLLARGANPNVEAQGDAEPGETTPGGCAERVAPAHNEWLELLRKHGFRR